MAYITKRGSSYGVRYTYQDEQGKNCNKWESFSTKEEATNRTRTCKRNFSDSVHHHRQRIFDGVASQAVQQTQVGTLHLSIQSGNGPKPHYSVHWRYADAETQALPSGRSVRYPWQNALRPVSLRQKASAFGKTTAAVSLRHDHP